MDFLPSQGTQYERAGTLKVLLGLWFYDEVLRWIPPPVSFPSSPGSWPHHFSPLGFIKVNFSRLDKIDTPS